MYTVYHSVDDSSPMNALYFPSMVFGGHEENSYVLSSGVVTNELNRAGSFEFTIPSTNIAYSDLSVYKSTVLVLDEHDIIFYGRIISIDRDVNNAKTAMCEGALGWLNDLVVSPHTFPNDSINYTNSTANNYYPPTFAGYVKWLLKQYNDWIGDAWHSKNRHIYATDLNGNINLQDADIDPNNPIEVNDYRSVLSCIENAYENLLVEGYYYVKTVVSGTSYRSYLTKTPEEPILGENYPRIEFGENLLDFSENFDGTSICNVLIPLGKTDSDGNPVNISSIPTIDTETIHHDAGSISLVSKRLIEECGGRVERVVNYSDIEDPQTLYDTVASELDHRVMGAKQTIQLGAVDAKMIDDGSEPIRIANFVECISVPHGMSSTAIQMYLASRVENNLLDPSQDVFEFTMDGYARENDLSSRSSREDSERTRQIAKEAYVMVQEKREIMFPITRSELDALLV